MAKTTVIKKGTILTITSGEYDDYRYEGVFEALQDIDVIEAKRKFAKKHPPIRREPSTIVKIYPPIEFMEIFDFDLFRVWLIENGFIRQILYQEWFLGEYQHSPSFKVYRHEPGKENEMIFWEGSLW